MAEIGSKLMIMRVFSEEEEASVNKDKTAGNVIDSVLAGNAMDVKKVRRRQPDKTFIVMVDETSFFVGSEYADYAGYPMVKSSYEHNEWLHFCVGKITEDGRIVFIDFVEPTVSRYHSLRERRRRKKLQLHFNTIIVQSDGVGVILDGQERRYVEMSEVTFENVRWHLWIGSLIDEDTEEEKKKLFSYRCSEVEKLIISNFSKLPEPGREIVGKSRDIIKNALMHDDSLASGYY